ncbi:MAG: TRAP transporter large permease [Deltaproteobacteria bacterium]|nr:TRAP transporter large permease [Deltaproteobacteria bacterium]
MDVLIGLSMILCFCFLAALGLAIPFAFLLPCLTGLVLFWGGLDALGIAARSAITTTDSFIMLALPLFMMMGELISRSGIAGDAFDTLELWLKRIPGGLVISSILGCAICGACTGSSIATTLTMANATLPKLVPRGYNKSLLAGVLGGSSIGMIIPPSSGFIIYGRLSDASIAKLFMAGLTAGIIMTLIFMVYIVIRVALNPSLAPALAEDVTWRRRLVALKYFWPFPVIIGGVLGSMYGGVATPVEASALGVVAVTLVSYLRGTLTMKLLKETFLATARNASWLLLILFVGMTFGHLVVKLGVSSTLESLLVTAGVPPWMVIAGMLLLVIIMGCFIDGASIMILTVPIFMPIIDALGYDPIWFGLQIMITIEIGLITPPMGISCYVLAGVMQPYGITLEQVFRANFVYVLLMSLSIAIFFVFPDLVMWLPNRM